MSLTSAELFRSPGALSAKPERRKVVSFPELAPKPLSADSLAQEYVTRSGRMRSLLQSNEGFDVPSISDLLAERRVLIGDFMKGRIDPKNLGEIAPNIDEAYLQPEVVGETILNKSIDFRIASGTQTDKDTLKKEIVNQRHLDSVISERFGITNDQISERIPRIRVEQNQRRLEQWKLEQRARKEAKAARLQEVRAKEEARLRRMTEVREQLAQFPIVVSAYHH